MKAHSTAKPDPTHHHGSAGQCRGGQAHLAAAVADSRPEMEHHHALLGLMAGSPLLQRTCACGAPSATGGSCAACEPKATGAGPQVLQKQLAIGAADDPLEREADRVADQVMRIEASGQSAQGTSPPRIQRLASHATSLPAGDVAPPSVERALSGSGRPLEPALRQEMERRFGQDFSHVRIHVDGAATEAVQAHAFTVGHDIVFGAQQYRPHTAAGRRLLAHELTHVVQQSPDAFGGVRQVELPAGTVSTTTGPSLQRKVAVEKPKDLIANPTGKGLVKTNAETVEGYLQSLCSGGSVSVDKVGGGVSLAANFCTPTPLPPGSAGPPSPPPALLSKEPAGCSCLCDMVGSANAYTIVVDDADWPHTSGRVVTAPSPNSPKLWGAATVSGKTTTIDPWLVLGHEFCGHAWLAEKGLPDQNATRGEGGHQETVARENELRLEHGIEARGSFKDPYCGESFWQDKARPGPVQWSSYLKKCEAWRKKTYGNKYKMSDKIP
jgi:hypothetical protein